MTKLVDLMGLSSRSGHKWVERNVKKLAESEGCEFVPGSGSGPGVFATRG